MRQFNATHLFVQVLQSITDEISVKESYLLMIASCFP